MYEIRAYYRGGLLMTLNMTTPSAKTEKLEIKVNEFLRLFNLS